MAIATKRKTSSRIPKKHTGNHKGYSQHYSKPYWPYLPLVAIVALGLVLNGVWSSQMRGVDGYATHISPASLLVDTNSQRTAHKESALTLSSQLNAAAQAKANDMVQKNYWSHVTPSGEQPWQFITAEGYNYQSAGENLAYGFADSTDVLSAWMASTEHRANILDGNYQNVGFGIANSPNFQGAGPTTVVVAEYGQPLASAAAANMPTGSSLGVSTASAAPSESVARIQLLSGNTSYAVLAVSLIASLAAILFILRHGLAFKRLITEGESFVLHHRYLDVAIVLVIVAGVLLTRTAGVIH